MAKKTKNKFFRLGEQAGQRIRRFFDLLFRNQHEVFLRYSQKQADPRGNGFWVYYDSYADFKKRQRQTRLVSLSTMAVLSAIIIVELLVNLIIPAVFRSEAFEGNYWQQPEEISFSAGAADEALYVDDQAGITLLAGQEKSESDDLNGWSALADSALHPAIVRRAVQPEIIANQGYSYNTKTNPALPSDIVSQVWLDDETGLLYASTWAGLAVIDTAKTIDPADDRLVVVYSLLSQPKLASNYVYHSWLDKAAGYLYVSTWAGLAVIDTAKTIDPADDSLIINYSSSGRAPLAYNKARYSFLDESQGLLYVSTDGGGLSIINTKKTADPADDLLVGQLDKSSQPALPENRVEQAFTANGYLYVSTWGGGLAVFQVVADQTDNWQFVPVGQPLLPGERLYQTALADSGEIYVASASQGVAIFQPFKDDAGKIISFSQSGEYRQKSQILGNDMAASARFSSNGDFVYVGTTGAGIAVIDRGKSQTVADDALFSAYRTDTSPALASNNVNQIWLGERNGLIYAATEDAGISVVSPGIAKEQGEIISRPYFWAEPDCRAIAWNSAPGSAARWRQADKSAVVIEEFSDFAAARLAPYLGNGFPASIQGDSMIKLNGAVPASGGVSFKLKFSGQPDFFPADSIIRIKLKAETGADYEGVVFLDDWENGSTYFYSKNKWESIVIRTASAFSEIGFGLKWDSAKWKSDNGLIIDRISIEPANLAWSQWSAPVTAGYLPLSGIDKVWQFEFSLDKGGEKVDNLRILSGCQPVGAYISPEIKPASLSEWGIFNVKTDILPETKLDFSFRTYREGQWSGWQPILAGDNLGQTAEKLQYRADFQSLAGWAAPWLKEVKINWQPVE